MAADAASTNSLDLKCPSCGYSLRGLPKRRSIRCPECGQSIDVARAVRTLHRDPFSAAPAQRLTRAANFFVLPMVLLAFVLVLAGIGIPRHLPWGYMALCTVTAGLFVVWSVLATRAVRTNAEPYRWRMCAAMHGGAVGYMVLGIGGLGWLMLVLVSLTTLLDAWSPAGSAVRMGLMLAGGAAVLVGVYLGNRWLDTYTWRQCLEAMMLDRHDQAGAAVSRSDTIGPMTPDDARALMHEWTASESLRTHMECVAACMAACAERYEPDQRDRWIICGLLHDFDYEKHPSKEEHPFVGVAHLRERGDVDAEIIDAILGHAEYSGTPRTSAMAKCLFAVDELAGFIVACAKVRPNGIADLQPKSVKKKLKDKAFAAAVSREDIRQGIAELDVDETEHIQRCIDAIRQCEAVADLRA